MNREDIIRMAEENGIVIIGEAMFRFAAIVAAAEREACAKVCEDFDFEFQDDSAGTLKGAAEAIRARGEE